MSGERPASGDVSVVVPVLNAAPFLPALLRALAAQEPEPPQEILFVDSGSTDGTREIAASCARARIVPIEDFTHGRARNLGAQEARGKFVAFLTQDALPRDPRWLACLLEPLADPGVAAAFSRQIPRMDAKPMERFFLRTRFPASPAVRRERRGDETPTLESVFFSNVSAVIRRELLLRHPFDEELIMSEDQQWARDVIVAGHATVYQPSSVVVHSHDYPLGKVFRRYFDSVHSLTVIFPDHGVRTSVAMGLGYLAREAAHMARRPRWWGHYLLHTVAKAAGTVAGHAAPWLPRFLVRRMSLHRYHWDRRR